MVKQIIRAMPNLQNPRQALGIFLLLFAGGMIFFAGNEFNQILKALLGEMVGDGAVTLVGITIMALIFSTGGYLLMKGR